MFQKTEEISSLEALESQKLQGLQVTRKLEEERITKFESFIETNKQRQERRLKEQLERLREDKIKYRSPINVYQHMSTLSGDKVKPGIQYQFEDSTQNTRNSFSAMH